MHYRVECDNCEASFEIHDKWQVSPEPEYCPFCGEQLDKDCIEEIDHE